MSFLFNMILELNQSIQQLLIPTFPAAKILEKSKKSIPLIFFKANKTKNKARYMKLIDKGK